MKLKNEWSKFVYVLLGVFEEEDREGEYDHVKQIIYGRSLHEAAELTAKTGFLDDLRDPVSLIGQLEEDMTITVRLDHDVYMIRLITDRSLMYHEISSIFEITCEQFDGIDTEAEIKGLLDEYNEACMALPFHLSRIRFDEELKPSSVMHNILSALPHQEAKRAKQVILSVSEEAFEAAIPFFMGHENRKGPLVLFGDTDKAGELLRLFSNHLNRFGWERCIYLDERDLENICLNKREFEPSAELFIVSFAQLRSHSVLTEAVRILIERGYNVVMTSDNPEVWTLSFDQAQSAEV